MPTSFTNRTYRDLSAARAMAKEVVNNTPVAELDALDNGEHQCPVCDDIMVKFHNFSTRENKENCFAFGSLVSKQRLKDALEVDAVDVWEMDGFPFRYNLDESPLWAKAFKLLDDPRSLIEIVKVTAKNTVAGASEAGISAALLKHLPKLQNISGKDEKILLQRLKGLRQQLTQRGMDLDHHNTVQFVAALFIDELSDWWADTGRHLEINTVDELIDLIKKTFALKDFEGEHLISLIDVYQKVNSQQALNTYIRAFNTYRDEWKDEASFKWFSRMFIHGLKDADIRQTLVDAIKKDSFTSLPHDALMPELQRLTTQAFLIRSDPLAENSNSRSNRHSGNSSDKKGKEPATPDNEPAKKGKKRSRNGKSGGGQSNLGLDSLAMDSPGMERRREARTLQLRLRKQNSLRRRLLIALPRANA